MPDKVSRRIPRIRIALNVGIQIVLAAVIAVWYLAADLGVKNIRPLQSNSIHMDDPFGYDVQISGLESNALTDG